jgi:hypothetical protein
MIRAASSLGPSCSSTRTGSCGQFNRGCQHTARGELVGLDQQDNSGAEKQMGRRERPSRIGVVAHGHNVVAVLQERENARLSGAQAQSMARTRAAARVAALVSQTPPPHLGVVAVGVRIAAVGRGVRRVSHEEDAICAAIDVRKVLARHLHTIFKGRTAAFSNALRTAIRRLNMTSSARSVVFL